MPPKRNRATTARAKVWKFEAITNPAYPEFVFATREAAVQCAVQHAKKYLTKMWDAGEKEFFANAREDMRRPKDERRWEVQMPQVERFHALMSIARSTDADRDWLAASDYADDESFEPYEGNPPREIHIVEVDLTETKDVASIVADRKNA